MGGDWTSVSCKKVLLYVRSVPSPQTSSGTVLGREVGDDIPPVPTVWNLKFTRMWSDRSTVPESRFLFHQSTTHTGHEVLKRSVHNELIKDLWSTVGEYSLSNTTRQNRERVLPVVLTHTLVFRPSFLIEEIEYEWDPRWSSFVPRSETKVGVWENRRKSLHVPKVSRRRKFLEESGPNQDALLNSDPSHVVPTRGRGSREDSTGDKSYRSTRNPKDFVGVLSSYTPTPVTGEWEKCTKKDWSVESKRLESELKFSKYIKEGYISIIDLKYLTKSPWTTTRFLKCI